jgi:hypothetical protein
MHYYEFMTMVFVCTIIPLLWCGLFYIEMCIGHAKISFFQHR